MVNCLGFSQNLLDRAIRLEFSLEIWALRNKHGWGMDIPHNSCGINLTIPKITVNGWYKPFPAWYVYSWDDYRIQ